jgi:hypothetical protein
MVRIPGAKKLKVELQCDIKSSSVSSNFSMDMSWFTLAHPEVPEGQARPHKNYLIYTHCNIILRF